MLFFWRRKDFCIDFSWSKLYFGSEGLGAFKKKYCLFRGAASTYFEDCSCSTKGVDKYNAGWMHNLRHLTICALKYCLNDHSTGNPHDNCASPTTCQLKTICSPSFRGLAVDYCRLLRVWNVKWCEICVTMEDLFETKECPWRCLVIWIRSRVILAQVLNSLFTSDFAHFLSLKFFFFFSSKEWVAIGGGLRCIEVQLVGFDWLSGQVAMVKAVIKAIKAAGVGLNGSSDCSCCHKLSRKVGGRERERGGGDWVRCEKMELNEKKYSETKKKCRKKTQVWVSKMWLVVLKARQDPT